MTTHSGTCMCGNIKYTIAAEPIVSRICWCKDCQKISANGTVNFIVPRDAIQHSGELSQYSKISDNGNQVTRHFCSHCGTHLFADSSARPQFSVVRTGTLDNPSSIRPTANIWTGSAPEWACMDTSLEMAERQPAPPQQPQK